MEIGKETEERAEFEQSSQVRLEVRENEAKSILYRLNVPKLPFHWGANPYRGCQHDCWYCYARYTHEYLQLPLGMFQHVVFAKVNAATVLRKELMRRSWKRELVNLGTVTDPYQPIERRYRITRQMMQVFMECDTPVVLSTKSHLVLDDLDLLTEFSRKLFLNIVFSLTSTDEKLKRMLEPSTATVKQRFKAAEQLAKAGITVGVVMSPIFPALTDSRENMEKVVRMAADSGVSYFLADTLTLRSSARQYLLPYLEEHFPEVVPRYKALYRGDYPPREIVKGVKAMQYELAAEYGVNHYDRMLYTPPAEAQSDESAPAETESGQLELIHLTKK
ncbi:MAG TPA: radical SAM protein [Blastocatellia bacterium]|jgi:DNA repair photolyase